jgi:hypothetical protein
MEEQPSVLPSYMTSLLRSVATTLGGYLIGKGYITADQAPQFAGLVVVVGTAIWSLYQKWLAHKRLTAAIAAPAGAAS